MAERRPFGLRFDQSLEVVDRFFQAVDCVFGLAPLLEDHAQVCQALGQLEPVVGDGGEVAREAAEVGRWPGRKPLGRGRFGGEELLDGALVVDHAGQVPAVGGDAG